MVAKPILFLFHFFFFFSSLPFHYAPCLKSPLFSPIPQPTSGIRKTHHTLAPDTPYFTFRPSRVETTTEEKISAADQNGLSKPSPTVATNSYIASSLFAYGLPRSESTASSQPASTRTPQLQKIHESPNPTPSTHAAALAKGGLCALPIRVHFLRRRGSWLCLYPAFEVAALLFSRHAAHR